MVLGTTNGLRYQVSLNHFIRPQPQRLRNREANSPGRLQIERQFERSWFLHRQRSWLSTLQHPVHEAGRTAPLFCPVRAKGHEATRKCERTQP